MSKQQTCVTYYRVSSGAQKERGSIARQDQLIPALVKHRGLRVIGEYRDDGVSGRTIQKRDDFSRLLADLPKFRPDFIVFLRADRFGRPQDWATLMELVNAAPQHKVNLCYGCEDSLTGDLQTTVVPYSDRMGLTRFQVELVQAGVESERKGRDIRQGNFSNLVRGRWPFGQVPFGWQYDRQVGRFVALPDQIGTLRFIYAEAASGKGTPLIAQELRRRKVLLPKAVESEKRKAKLAKLYPGGEYRWEQSAVRRLLEREYHYTGLMRYNVAESYPDLLKAYREGRAGNGDCKLTADGFTKFAVLVDGQPAIDAATWKAAREYVDRRAKRHGGERRGERRAFLWGPWLKCECGGNLKARAHKFKNPCKGLTTYHYYSCRFHAADSDRDGRPACTVPHLHADDIDTRLWGMLLDWIARPSTHLERWLRGRGESVDPGALRAEIVSKEAGRAAHERDRSKWLDLFAEDSIDKAELTRRSRADAAAVERLDGEIDTLRRRLDAATGDDAATAKARKMLVAYERGMADAADDLRRQLDTLDWHARRTLLTRLLGPDPITLGWRPYASIRAIQKRRGQDPDAFMARWCVQSPKGDETEGLFIVGVVLPVRPSEIIDALAAVGVRPAFASKVPALGSRCA